jgi:hypothetical protein
VEPEDLYHTGIVVEDFGRALAWLTDAAGYRWCDEAAVEQVVWTPDGDQKVPIRFAYSMSEPRLEVIEAVPGTVWTPADSGIHHLGYWSADVDRDLEALGARGMQTEARQLLQDGSTLWAYCRGTAGPRVELVSRALEPMMTTWFATGRSPFA